MDQVAGVPVVAPELGGRAVFDQRWTDLAFLHWPVSPALVAPYLPAGVRPDVLDGVSYVGLIPFHMRDAGLGRGHPTAYLGNFLETNVRLYGVDDQGRHGVVFRSLEASRLPTVLGARWGYRLPYVWSRMRVQTSVATEGEVWTWTSRRRWPDRGLATRISVRVGEPVTDLTPLDIWLTARWGLHHRAAGRTWWTPNHHGPWPLRAASLLHLDDDLLGAAGFDVAGEAPVHVRFSAGVRTVFGRPQRI
jgi:uncharacterized protein YqjF (DUF2071 family)